LKPNPIKASRSEFLLVPWKALYGGYYRTGEAFESRIYHLRKYIRKYFQNDFEVTL